MNKQMLYLYSCAIHGTMPEENEYNLNEIYSCAKKQGVWHIIYPVIEKMTGVSEQLKNEYKYDVMHNIYKTNFVHKTIKVLEEAGIRCVVLKGETLKELYHNPENRLCSDADLYIGKKNLKAAIKVMEQLGYKVETYQNGGWDHHRVCEHKVGGIVELHTELYDDDYDKIWFSGLNIDLCNVREIKCDDGMTIKTLSVNDGLIFIAMHLIKHFIGQGIGIRHFSDVLLYIKKYKNDIEFELFKNTLKQYNFYTFFNICVKLGIKYLGFQKEIFEPYFDTDITADDSEAIEKILEDIFDGGAFGKENEKAFKLILNQKKLGANYSRYRKKKQTNRFIMLFSYGYMRSSYPWLKKYPFLLPVAWFRKIFLYIFNPQKSVTTVVTGKRITTNDRIDKRLDLMKKLDILK